MQETLDRSAVVAKSMRPCSHCGLPTFVTDDRKHVFCCHGCMGAFAMIHEMGLEDFYALRRNAQPANNRALESRATILDDLDAAGVAVQPMNDGLCSVRLSVDGLHCAACSWLIERMQPTIRGLQSAQVRMSDHTVELIYDPQVTHPAQVSKRLAKLGYSLSPWTSGHDDEKMFLSQQRDHWTGIALAFFFAANAMWIGIALYAGEATGINATHEYFLRWVGTVLACMAVAFPGRIFFQTALQAIRTKTPHIDIPVAFSLLIGISGAIYGAITGVGQTYFDSLASLILLLRIGRYIQFRAQYRTSLWVSQLLRLNAVVATRVESDGSHKTLPAHRLKLGDRVLVQPGETIPADGIALANLVGNEVEITSIDMSLVNGESTPVAIRVGDALIGGTTNLSSPLYVSVTAVGEETRVGRLMEIVRNATTHRTPWIMAADRVSKWFVLAVMFLSIATWATWTWIASASVATEHTMALLTIACPCALALAAPLVLTVALGRAAKKQIWIRDGNCLEKLATPGTLWLDKTGTLTYGRMTVLDWQGKNEWLRHAAALEQNLVHPIAAAIHEYAIHEGNAYQPLEAYVPWSEPAESAKALPKVECIEHIHGKGVRGTILGQRACMGNEAWMEENDVSLPARWKLKQSEMLAQGQTVVWLAVENSVVGMFGIGDSLRQGAAETLRAISARGWRLGIVSGDRQEIVERLASDLRAAGVKLEAVLGDRFPEEKLEVIRACKSTHEGPCVMVGDGVNDAAAMALSDVGIAIRGGSEQALHAAPIYLANQQLSSVVELIDASKSVVGGIRRCFAASLLYNSVTIALAATGFIHPLIAAILMPISGVTVLTMAITTRSFTKRA